MVQVWGWKWGEWGVGHYCEVARRVQEYLGFRVVVARKVHSADAAGAGGGVGRSGNAPVAFFISEVIAAATLPRGGAGGFFFLLRCGGILNVSKYDNHGLFKNVTE